MYAYNSYLWLSWESFEYTDTKQGYVCSLESFKSKYYHSYLFRIKLKLNRFLLDVGVALMDRL